MTNRQMIFFTFGGKNEVKKEKIKFKPAKIYSKQRKFVLLEEFMIQKIGIIVFRLSMRLFPNCTLANNVCAYCRALFARVKKMARPGQYYRKMKQHSQNCTENN